MSVQHGEKEVCPAAFSVEGFEQCWRLGVVGWYRFSLIGMIASA